MRRTRERGRAIRDYILGHVRAHPEDVAQICADYFDISRQAVNKHLGRLVADGFLTADGVTRNRRYSLAVLDKKEFFVPLGEAADEDAVWRTEVAPLLSGIPDNARRVWQYGFTEMLNNAIDHSSGTSVRVLMARTAVDCSMSLIDDGEGIFRKITRALGLDDERHAVLELAKGKLTTDPEHHTGEGIFFTSRLFDEFNILSHKVFFLHDGTRKQDWIQEVGLNADATGFRGTLVVLELSNGTTKTLKQVFDDYAADGDYGFSKTVVPVHLVQYGDEALISRSQAKRLLTRFDRFTKVILDFNGVEQIGQAFADEVFRVFTRAHPNVEIEPFNATPEVDAMIRRARSAT